MHLIAGNSFAPVELIEAGLNLLSHFLQMKLTQTILVVQKPKPLADHFARGLIEAAFDFARHKLFQFRCQRYVHKFLSSQTSLSPRQISLPEITKNVQSCYWAGVHLDTVLKKVG